MTQEEQIKIDKINYNEYERLKKENMNLIARIKILESNRPLGAVDNDEIYKKYNELNNEYNEYKVQSDSKIKMLLKSIDDLKEAQFRESKSSFNETSKTKAKIADLEQKLDIITGKLAVFISLKVKEDATIQKYKDRENKLSKYFDDIAPSLAFVTTQLNEISDERLKKLAQNPNFSDYDISLLDIIKGKPHILSEAEEKLLAQVSECIGGAGEVFDMYDSIDVKFDDVIV